MSPSHANKQGVRYRYYISRAVLENRKSDIGSVPRVSAPELEALVCDALRTATPIVPEMSDRELIEKHVDRIVIRSSQIHIVWQPNENQNDQASFDQQPTIPRELTIPFVPVHGPKKGIAHNPASQAAMTAEQRDAILQAIARSRNWLDSILAGKVASVDDIATKENLAERHIRFLMPLAFLSPRVIEAIANAPGDLTISNLARALPHKWLDQERALAIS